MVEFLFAGVVVGALFVELVGIYPGGIIVPGYIALYLDQPLRVVGTLAVSGLSLASFLILSRFLILYGRRRFALLLLLGGAWTLVWYTVLPAMAPASLELRSIGWVIPGLIANAFERQGITTTTVAMLTAATAVFFVVKLLLML